VFPVVDGIPVMVNEQRSLFSTQEIVARRGIDKLLRENSASANAPFKERFFDALPKLSKNRKADELFTRFAALLRDAAPQSRVLVVGGGVLGAGMDRLVAAPHVELIESDVYLGPRNRLVCDATDLPFEDQSLDGVVIQAVLGNVMDPERAAAEIWRVLRPDGLVYVETAFMQQVYLGRYDFTRYSLLGLRRLFRWFDEVASGTQGGPGMASAWSYQYLLWSFTTSSRARAWLRLFARCTGFWLVALDRFLINRPSALDAASGHYFLGRRSERCLSDRELVAAYRGGFE
jgi:SAM-dependent methyltransferase